MANVIGSEVPFVPKTSRPYQNKNFSVMDSGTAGSLEKPDENDRAVSDTLTLGRRAEVTQTYSRSSVTRQPVSGDGFDLLRSLVVEMLNEQGVDYKMSNDTEGMDISQLSRGEARTLIAENGYFGVSQTSERIADFAIALAGGDPTRLAMLKDAVEQGFKEAADALGGWLPDISYQTHDAVMEKLDAWAQQAAA